MSGPTVITDVMPNIATAIATSKQFEVAVRLAAVAIDPYRRLVPKLTRDTRTKSNLNATGSTGRQ